MNRTTDRVQVYRRGDGRWAWRRLAPNGQVIATDGGQGYEDRDEAVRMAYGTNGDVGLVEVLDRFLDD